ncbi:MAG: hypothetical protein ACI4MG_06485 [Aristaeellaceae bacterium]
MEVERDEGQDGLCACAEIAGRAAEADDAQEAGVSAAPEESGCVFAVPSLTSRARRGKIGMVSRIEEC